jgi:hypothetical protein
MPVELSTAEWIALQADLDKAHAGAGIPTVMAEYDRYLLWADERGYQLPTFRQWLQASGWIDS